MSSILHTKTILFPEVEWPRSHKLSYQLVGYRRSPRLVFGDHRLQDIYQLRLQLSRQQRTVGVVLKVIQTMYTKTTQLFASRLQIQCQINYVICRKAGHVMVQCFRDVQL